MWSPEIRRCFSVRRNLRALFVPPSDRFTSLDGIRGISIIYVVIFHCFGAVAYLGDYDIFVRFGAEAGFLHRWVFNADKAVDAFFVLSGFLIGNILLGEQKKTGSIRYGRFLIRRAFRLSPVYYSIMILATLVLVYAYSRGNDTAQRQLPWVWTNYLYVNNFIPRHVMFMDWTWSLAIEEQFYLLLPPVLLLTLRSPRLQLGALVGLFAASFAIRGAIVWYYDGFCDMPLINLTFPGQPCHGDRFWNALYMNLYTRYGCVIVGVLCAWLYTFRREDVQAFFERRWAVSVPLTLVAIALLLAQLWAPAAGMRPPFTGTANMIYLTAHRNVFGLALGVLILAMLFPVGPARWARRFLSLRCWYPFAQLSYTIYLVHIFFAGLFMLNVVGTLEAPPPRIGLIYLSAAGALTVSSCLCMFFFLFLERPFMEMRKLVRFTR